MSTLARLTLCATLLGTACAQPDEDPSSLAVVFVDEDGLTLTVGSYDQLAGELTFLAGAHDDLREQVEAVGGRALVVDDDERVEVDLDAGVCLIAEELGEGDALELRIAGADRRTVARVRLVLHAADAAFRMREDSWTIIK